MRWRRVRVRAMDEQGLQLLFKSVVLQTTDVVLVTEAENHAALDAVLFTSTSCPLAGPEPLMPTVGNRAVAVLADDVAGPYTNSTRLLVS